MAFLLLYGLTAAPSVATVFDDSLEFQVVAYTLGIAHPTGYPLYTLLGWLVTRLPWAEPAQGVNLLSALFGAVTVAGLYGVGRQLTCGRLAAAAGAVAVGVSPVLWSQSTIAEVYTLHTAFVVVVLWLALWAGEAQSRWRTGVRRAYPLAVVFGLSLTHHRMSFLLLPALLAYLWWAFGRRFRVRHWRRLAGLALAPLLLYAYLPLRGMFTSSLDGTYVNSPAGFLNHVTGAGYNVFLAGQAPGIPPRDASAYLELFLDQFGPLALALALLGLAVLLRRRGPVLLLGLTLALNLAFALSYRVADYEVFFLPSFVLTGILLAQGTDALRRWAGRVLGRLRPGLAAGGHLLPGLVLLIALAPLPYRWPEQDRSQAWSVARLGRAWLSSAEPGSVVVGILGETTLMRYFQVSEGLAPGTELVAADDERVRLDTVSWLVSRGRTTYLTRPLPGVGRTFALDAAGELIRVSRPQSGEQGTGTEVAPGLRLVGWQWTVGEHRGRANLSLHLRWNAPHGLSEPLKISARASRDGQVVAALDAEPVHNAYPTPLWRPGEVVEDYYLLEMPVGDPGGTVDVSVVVYSPETGAQRGQAGLGSAQVPPSPGERPAAEWGLRPAATWLSDGTRLVGVSLAPRTQARVGETLPLGLLWRSRPWSRDSTSLMLRLTRRGGGTAAELPVALELGGTRPSGLLRQDLAVTLPARLESGTYRLLLESEGILLRWGWPPLTRQLELSVLEVQGRTRLYERPRPGIGLAATFRDRATDQDQARLIGYDLQPEGGRLRVILYWQALGEPDRSYKVFVHCLDAGGEILAQSDQEPDGGRAPTDSWIRGEYIIDHHQLDLPEGSEGCVQLLVGLYTADGVRMPATADTLVLGGDAVVLTGSRPK